VVGLACGEGAVCELFGGGGSTSAIVRSYLFTLDVGANGLPGRTNIHAYS